MLSPAGCQYSRNPAPPLLQVRLGGSALLGRLPLHCSSSLPPVRVAGTASLPFLPSSVGLLPTLGSRESVLLVFWQFSGLFRQMGWNLSGQQDEVSPVSSYAAIFLLNLQSNISL